MPIYSDALILNDLKTFLNSKYSISTQRYILDLLERKQYDSSINQYRIFNKNTNSYLTNFDDFVNNITDIKVSYGYNFNGSIKDNMCHPFTIDIMNYDIKLNKHSFDDVIYFNRFGYPETKRITFVCSYYSDSSDTFQILEVYLSPAN